MNITFVEFSDQRDQQVGHRREGARSALMVRRKCSPAGAPKSPASLTPLMRPLRRAFRAGFVHVDALGRNLAAVP